MRTTSSPTLILALIFLTGPQSTHAQETAPAINHSLVAFTIPEKDLLPENVAFDPVSSRFFVGSTRRGKIVQVNRTGHERDFVPPGGDGLWAVLGMKVDAARRHLWVLSATSPNLIDNPRPTRAARVHLYDLDGDTLIRRWELSDPDTPHLLNDLTITASGDVYMSHTVGAGSVYRIRGPMADLELFFRNDDLRYPNGITMVGDTLLLLAYLDGVAVVDIENPSAWRTVTDSASIVAEIDGLYVHDGKLIAIQPRRGTVIRATLTDDLRAVADVEILERGHPMFATPTTGVVVGDTLYYVANSQFGVARRGLPPLEQLYEVVILKVGLD